MTTVQKIGACLTTLIVLGTTLWSVVPHPNATAKLIPPPIKIGAIYPISGPDKNLGLDTQRGVELAVRYLSHTGGFPELGLSLPSGRGLPNLHGAEIDPIFRDSGGDRCNAQSLVDDLADNQVLALIGAYESTVTRAVLREARQIPVPLVNEASTAPNLTKPHTAQQDDPCDGSEDLVPDPAPSQWFFRVGPNDDDAAKRFEQWLDQRRRHGMRVQKIAVVYESEDNYGNDALNATQVGVIDKLNQTRGKLPAVTLDRFPYRRKPRDRRRGPCDTRAQYQIYRELTAKAEVAGERTTLIQGIRKSDPDVIFVASYSDDAILLAQGLARDTNYQIPPLLAYGAGFGSREFRHDIHQGQCGYQGTDPPTVISRVAWSEVYRPLSPAAQEVMKRFNEEYPRTPMTENSARGFTAMLALATAINKSGLDAFDLNSPEKVKAARTKVKEALHDLIVGRDKTIMPWEGIQFDHDGQNRRARFLLERKPGNGQPTIVSGSGDTAEGASGG